MKLNKLLRKTGIIQYGVRGNTSVCDVTNDSRAVQPKSVFFAIEGEKTDGHEFVRRALANGAVAVVEKREFFERGCVLVKNSRAAYAAACACFYGNPAKKLKLVGITGTNGKTTASYLIRQILEYAGTPCGLIGTIESISDTHRRSDLTTADPKQLHCLLLRMKRAGKKAAVLEVSSHALKQRRTETMRFDVAVFTNLSQDHLDYHKTREDYLASKLRLFAEANAAAVNIDDPCADRVLAASTRSYTYSLLNTNADVYAHRVPCRNSVWLKIGSVGGYVALQPSGRPGLYNTAAAACAALALGLKPAMILRALCKQVCIPGRFQTVRTAAPCEVMIDFAHTPAALSEMLSAVREERGGRVIAVFGCGGARDRTKRPLMAEVAEEKADYTVVTSCNPRTERPADIISEIVTGFSPSARYVCVEDRTAAIELALRIARSGDIVVLAGKGHEHYQLFSDSAVPFDEAEIAKQIAQKLYGGPAFV